MQLVSGRTEGVGLNDVGPGANIFGVNLAHEIGVTEVQLVVAAIDVDAFGIQHRAHRTVEDQDAIAGENFFEWLHHENCRLPIADLRADDHTN